MAEPNFELNALYAMDNLDLMRGMDSETVDLIYLDPPFNSKRMYQGMSGTAAEKHKFKDTWSWTDAKTEWLEQLYDDQRDLYNIVMVAKAHSGGMGGYICFMAPRIIEMRRILKSNGTLYLHCDTSANSYIRNLLDITFGADSFRNEIVWERTHSKNAVGKDFGRNHDTIYRYQKGKQATFNKEAVRKPYSKNGEIPQGYSYSKSHQRYIALAPVHAPDESSGDSGKPAIFRGKTYQTPVGRHWIVPGGRLKGETTSQGWERMDQLGRMYLAPNGKYPMSIRFLDEMPGIALDDVWTDISIPGIKEDTGWKTQKPLALLERIIRASSNEGDIVFDPFCGCGTAMVVAGRLGRRWIGADDDTNAIDVVQSRIADLRGIPTDHKNSQQQLKQYIKVINRAEGGQPPLRTDLQSDEPESLTDPTRVIRSRKPSDRLTHDEMRTKLIEWEAGAGKTISCLGCREVLTLKHFELDHQQPKSDGGTNRIDNRILLCGPCNGKKSNRMTMTTLWKENGITKTAEVKPLRDRLKQIKEKAEAFIEELDQGHRPSAQSYFP